MRIGTVLGAALLVLGAFIAVRGLNYTRNRSVLKIGDLEAKVEEQRAIPAWVGGALALAGIGLIAYSARGRGNA
jgi:drug/metabolite transporter (DMT)-like permease